MGCLSMVLSQSTTFYRLQSTFFTKQYISDIWVNKKKHSGNKEADEKAFVHERTERGAAVHLQKHKNLKVYSQSYTIKVTH